MYQQIAAMKTLNQEIMVKQTAFQSDSLSNPNLNLIRNQAGMLTTDAINQEMNTQVIRFELTQDQVQINLPSFRSNLSGGNHRKNNDIQYYVSKLQINGLIPNITENSSFMMTVRNLVFYHPSSGRTYVLKESIPAGPGELNWTFDVNRWVAITMGEAGEYLTTVEVIRNIQRQLEGICASNIDTSDKVFIPTLSATPMITEIFKTTEMQYDNPNGKIMLVQKTKTMQNYYTYPIGTLVDIETGADNSNDLLKQSMFIASFDIQIAIRTQHAPRIARQLGLSTKEAYDPVWSYADIVGKYQTQVLANFLLTSLWSVDEQGVIDPITASSASDLLEVYIPFHYPSNMFWTTQIYVVTNLGTNSWNSYGKSNILYVATLDKTGQQTDTVEVRNDQTVLHSTSMESLKSFQINLLDDYEKPLNNIKRLTLELVVLVK